MKFKLTASRKRRPRRIVSPVAEPIKPGLGAPGHYQSFTEWKMGTVKATQSIAAFDPATGDLAWVTEVPGTTSGGNIATAGDLALEAVGRSFYALDAALRVALADHPRGICHFEGYRTSIRPPCSAYPQEPRRHTRPRSNARAALVARWGGAMIGGGTGVLERVMRRSRKVDWLLLATLLPLYLALQFVGIQAYLSRDARFLPLWWISAEGPERYPSIHLPAPVAGLESGDRVLRAGGEELRGLSGFAIGHRLNPVLGRGGPVELEVDRAGVRHSVLVTPRRVASWWWPLPAWGVLALTAVFLLLRAPHWSLARSFFASSLLWCAYGASLGPVPPVLGWVGFVPGQSLAMGLTAWLTLAWKPPSQWSRFRSAIPWLIGIVAAFQFSSIRLSGGPSVQWPIAPVLTSAVCITALARAYGRSDALERRQLRWIALGVTASFVPRVLVLVVSLFVPLDDVWFNGSFLFVAAVPLGIAIAIGGYHWLDIDRVISASAAATLVGVALLGGGLAVVPPLARGASAALGIDPEAGRLALSMALAAVGVPAYRALRPRLDRRLFAEQQRTTEAFARLRGELAGCRGLEELAARSAAGFETLLRPDSLVTYALAGEAFTPLLVRGRAAPPAFAAASTLVRVLEAKAAPLFARAKALDPFERAALETLGAEVVVPVLGGGRLVAFTTLGGKRSGDIYTASDLALLASVAERAADVLARLDADAVAHEARTLQAALRRYVPGAVAERVLAGDALEPAEREVTVLFVDIRGYTGVAERLTPKDVFATLNEHTERVSRVVQDCGGAIVEFNGDGMMAVFGAPEALAQKEQQAVLAARRIVDTMPAQLGVGVGVATGPAFVGSIRSTDRLIWSAVGSTTNLAARLQALTRDLAAAIALDETTRERAAYICSDFARHADLAIRGRTGRFDVFALPLRRAA